jgi:hypothetical protein
LHHFWCERRWEISHDGQAAGAGRALPYPEWFAQTLEVYRLVLKRITADAEAFEPIVRHGEGGDGMTEMCLVSAAVFRRRVACQRSSSGRPIHQDSDRGAHSAPAASPSIPGDDAVVAHGVKQRNSMSRVYSSSSASSIVFMVISHLGAGRTASGGQPGLRCRRIEKRRLPCKLLVGRCVTPGGAVASTALRCCKRDASLLKNRI